MRKPTGHKIPGLARKPKRQGGYFDDLPYQQRERARYWLRAAKGEEPQLSPVS